MCEADTNSKILTLIKTKKMKKLTTTQMQTIIGGNNGHDIFDTIAKSM